MSETLKALAQEFADELTATVHAVVGPSCQPFEADLVGRAALVTQVPRSGILLQAASRDLLRLDVEYRTIWDGSGDFLAIDTSSIKVFTAQGRQPLFRYEYVRSQNSNLASAHIHFHGNHPDLQAAMRDCGEANQRARRRKSKYADGDRPVELSDLHFPVGGSRFRPTLEDILHMLIEEFGVEPHQSRAAAFEALSVGREGWRRIQAATVARDAPEVAARVLRELGYTVEMPSSGVPTTKIDRLRQL